MCVIIEMKEDDLVHVNDKPVRKDMEGNWLAKEEMSMEEAKAFNQFRECLERFPKIHKAEYIL